MRMLEFVWPIRTGQSLFDVWFVGHLCFWVFAGMQLEIATKNRWATLAIMFMFALAWEAFERFAEHKWTQVWLHPESWANAILSDIFIAGVGGVLLGFWLAEQQ